MYTAGVCTQRLTIAELISIVSTRPSQLFGLYPQKGVLHIGSDADIVIWDPEFERNLYCNFPSPMGAPVESFKLRGRAEFVFIKGQMAYNGERYFTENIQGHFLYRTPV